MKLERNKSALARLEAQLVSGVKTEKKSNKQIPLTDSDKKRIEKEIETLLKRV
jgi:hypothetical protein